MRYCHFKTPFLNLENYELNIDTVRLIPKEIVSHYQIVAIEQLGNILTVGITDLKTKDQIPILEQQLNFKYVIFPIFIQLSAWEKCFKFSYPKKEFGWYY